MHEGFEQFNPRNGDDRTDQFHFQISETNVPHPAWPVFGFAGVDLGDEILVTGEDDDDQQIAIYGQSYTAIEYLLKIASMIKTSKNSIYQNDADSCIDIFTQA